MYCYHILYNSCNMCTTFNTMMGEAGWTRDSDKQLCTDERNERRGRATDEHETSTRQARDKHEKITRSA